MTRSDIHASAASVLIFKPPHFDSLTEFWLLTNDKGGLFLGGVYTLPKTFICYKFVTKLCNSLSIIFTVRN